MQGRGFVSQTSTHLLPQALRFSQSNEQHCKCSGYQIHHAILSSVKVPTYPLRATDTGSTGAPSLAATKKQVRLSQTQIKYAIASFNL